MQGQQAQLVRVGEAGLLAADGAHPDPLVDVVAAILDDAVFQHPGLVPAALEIEVAELHLMAHQAAEQLLQAPFVQIVRANKEALTWLNRLNLSLHSRCETS